jgi:flavodoxin
VTNISIIFGSTGGNTELVCHRVKQLLETAGATVCIKRVEHCNITDATANPICILAASTYGHGILQDHFIPFKRQLQTADLASNSFAVIGLGDDKYDAEYNVESATILEDAVQQGGGEIILPALRINRSPIPHLTTSVEKWTAALLKKIEK